MKSRRSEFFKISCELKRMCYDAHVLDGILDAIVNGIEWHSAPGIPA